MLLRLLNGNSSRPYSVSANVARDHRALHCKSGQTPLTECCGHKTIKDGELGRNTRASAGTLRTKAQRRSCQFTIGMSAMWARCMS